MQQKPPEPGEVVDTSLGIPGPAEPLSEDDADQDESTLVNEGEDLGSDFDEFPEEHVEEEEPDQSQVPYEVVDNG